MHTQSSIHIHNRYKELSLNFYTILMSHADDLQAVSVDEALIDVTSSVIKLKESHSSSGPAPVLDHAKLLAETIRNQIREVTHCEGRFLILS
jgi:DNA repair protein REV1